MLPLTKSEAEMLDYAQQAGRESGYYFFPEELQGRAYDQYIAFGRIALQINNREAPAMVIPKEESAALDRMADAAWDISGILLSRIPVASISRLEADYRKNTVRAVRPNLQDVPFWQGEGTEIEVKKRYGMLFEWGLLALQHFQNRPLAKKDLAKVVYAERFDNTAVSVLTGYIDGSFMDDEPLQRITARLVPKDLRVEIVSEFHISGSRKNPRLICLPIDEDISRLDINESMRPTDDELRELAISIRLAESAKQQEQAAKPGKTTKKKTPGPQKTTVSKTGSNVNGWKPDEAISLKEPVVENHKIVPNQLLSDPETGFPPGFIQKIEELEEKLKHPPSHAEIMDSLREAGW